MTTAVLVPIKGFASAKGRLDGTLDAGQRSELARNLAARVLAAAAPLPVTVVCDDDEVATFARRHGAEVLVQREVGLNAAVTEGVEHLAAGGAERVLIAHADLPRAKGLAALASLAEATTSDAVVLVPDRHHDGTNVMVVPTGAGFHFAYGAGSFAAHRAEAERLGVAVVVVHDDDLAWDVDTAEDLAGL